MLTISFPDLKPNSQDTSAFYLQNIYQFQAFGNPNVSHLPIPSALAKPPAFSPPRYAIWVNSLWFLSLIVSLSGALVATLYRNWAVQYISITQPPWYTLAERARVRALFAKGNPGPYTIWGTGEESNYLHFSVLLFVVGSLIYLFNINRNVFYAVALWVGYLAVYYTIGTFSVFVRPNTLFHTPLSQLALNTYLSISYVVFQVCSCILPLHGLRDDFRRYYHDLRERYEDGILKGKRRQAHEIAFKPSSEVDTLILERLLLALDEDPALETFFDAIPGFCNSRLCILPLSYSVRKKFRQVLDGFLNRTFSSNLVSESVRVSRVITCLNAAHAALSHSAVSEILDNTFNGNWDKALQSVEMGHALRLWGHRRDHDTTVQWIIACIVARVRERDDRWTKLVKEEFGVPDHVLQASVAHGDNVLLSILIHISREDNRADSWTLGILSSFSKFDIRNTLPGLQHDFCTLWNEIAQKASNQGSYSTPVDILRDIRHLYVALHQDTEAAPTTFSSSTDDFDHVLFQPSSYPFCNVASHRPDFTTHAPVAKSGAVPPPTQPGDLPDPSPHQSTLGGGTALQVAEESDIITGLPSPPDPSSTSRIGETSRAPTAAFLDYPSSPSSDSFPQDGIVTARRPHPFKLDGNGNLYLASAVLQSLVYCPPFRELFRDLGQCEGGEIGGGPTPLVDATVRFLDEFAYKEKSSLAHQAARSKLREDEDGKKEDKGVHSFLSTDVYDALREKRRFISIRVRS